ncbi:Transcriptional regulator, PbsX family [Pseudomonas savastanoi pv. fraxini]|nr:Transcriptional regulator, PbsX family [Pseudomonas savastanoi pv. fraxini]RMR77652.1 Transcriptional regulator, PbsX family [Pseudomonas savastanoi pv. fraxini]
MADKDGFLDNKIEQAEEKVNKKLSIRWSAFFSVGQSRETMGFYEQKMDTLRSFVGAKIKALRKLSGMSQAALAEKIGCDAPLVGCYERGIHLPGVEQVIRIATVFDVAPGELLPGGQDILRTRLISLRQEIADKAIEVDSPESLEEILAFMNKYTTYNKSKEKS